VTGSSRRSKRIYHFHILEPGWKRYAQDKITLYHGPGVIHTRTRGDVLAHRCHVFMTPHRSKRSTSQRIRRRHVFSTRIQGPTTRANRLQPTHTPGTVIRDHMSVTRRKHNTRHGGARSADPLGWSNRPCHGLPSASTWCSVIGPTVDSQVHKLFLHR
jgi:hypothetical protein